MIKKHLLLLMLLFFPALLLASEVENSGARFVGVPNEPNNVNLGVWDGNSTMQSEEGFCAVSYLSFFFNFSLGIEFIFSSTQGYSNDNKFILINNKDGSSLSANLEVLNVDTGNYTTVIPETRIDGGTGRTNCNNQGQSPWFVRVTIEPEDLENASDGTYSAQVSFQSTNEGRTNPSTTDTFNITVQVPYIVQVSQLNNINLGTFSLTGNLSGEDQFCIFRNKNYAFNIRFNDGEGGVNYLLRGQNLNDTLPYKVSFRADSTSYVESTKNVPISYSPVTSSVNCQNSEKYYIKVETEQDDMIASLADNYNSTLSVIVSPE